MKTYEIEYFLSPALFIETLYRVVMWYSKTCVKQRLKIDKTKILMTNGSLMKVESIADAPHSAILLTCIKLLIGLEN